MDNYSIREKLGKGAFGTVYRVRHKSTNKEYAMKKIPNNGSSAKKVSIWYLFVEPSITRTI